MIKVLERALSSTREEREEREGDKRCRWGDKLIESIVFVSRFQLSLHPIVLLIKDTYIYIKVDSFNGSLILNLFTVKCFVMSLVPRSQRNVLFFFSWFMGDWNARN